MAGADVTGGWSFAHARPSTAVSEWPPLPGDPITTIDGEGGRGEGRLICDLTTSSRFRFDFEIVLFEHYNRLVHSLDLFREISIIR